MHLYEKVRKYLDFFFVYDIIDTRENIKGVKIKKEEKHNEFFWHRNQGGRKMKKKLSALIIAFCMCVPTASGFYVYENPREVPASVQKTPYMDSQMSTTYAPWLRNLHLTSNAEIDRGDYGGEACQLIRVMAISPLNPDIMYFGTDTSGIFKTENGGKTWYNTTNGYPGYYSQALMCDKFDENTVYFKTQKAGLARSRDGGKTWEELIPDKTTTSGGFVTLLDMDDSGNLYAALSTGIYKVDRVTEKVTNFLPQYESLTGKAGVIFNDIAVSGDGMHIYASATTNTNNQEAIPGLYVSHDGGKTWNIKGTDEKRNFSTPTLDIHPEDPMHVFVGGAFSDKVSGKAELFKLYESTDGGETLTEKYLLCYENLPEGVSKTPKEFVYMDFGPKNSEGIYPLYFVGNQITYPYRVSYDYGNSFSMVVDKETSTRDETNATSRQPAGTWYTGWWAQGMAIDMQNPGRLLISIAGPVLYDNGNVKYISTGFSGASITDIALDSQMRPFFVVVDSKIGITESGSMKDGGFPTVRLGKTGIFGAGGGDYDKNHTFIKAIIDPNDDNHVIAYASNNNATPEFDGVRQSYDGGKTWADFNKETTFSKANPAPIGATRLLEYDNEDKNTIYTTYYTSRDNGKTWEANEYYILAFSQKYGRMIGMKGNTKADAEFCVSDDKGKTWTPIIKPGYLDIDSIFIDNADKDTVWIARYYFIYKLNVSDGTVANYETKINGNGTFKIIKQNPSDPKHMLVISRPGGNISDKDLKLAETVDGGETWHAVPGIWGGYFNYIGFIGEKAYIGGHQGLLEYDYKKYHEFLENKITVIMNGREVSFDEMPQIINGRTMVPMRGLFEMLGATVNYDSNTRLITAQKGRDTISLTPGSDKAKVNGKEVVLDAAPFITDRGRTMIPLRFAAEALDVRVGWDNIQRTVFVTE